ncbi:MAG TPA: glycosyltransferase family 39 protein [Solirubrobacteraceae bacterium]|jgi:4-amino-4-deoxy-L-arabinose transferase-like glycosyltransferase|nr:glycosyltransferase family 39 protein [Solirubrobacteraceae bacterium]
MRRPVRPREWALLALITLAAAALRLIAIGKVETDPFYDAAVRSMGLSWHNFFFGAFEPGASVSIDKPPVDLWLQVASVKLFGFTPTALKLPEALSGIFAVPLLFVAVKRIWSTTAGLAAATALALLPVDVITSRSDTMDDVMMLLIVLAFVFVVRACESGKVGWLLAGAAVLGLAFDVKILESLVALPALGLIVLLGFPGSPSARVLKLLAAAAVYVVVALAWLGATLLAPAHDRPWAIGSTNGSAWNAVFVFNGSERLGGKSPEPQFTQYEPGHSYPVATQSDRDHIPIVNPSATRLLARIGPLSGERLGIELLAGLLLGIPALLWGLQRRQSDRDGEPDEDDDAAAEDDAAAADSAAGDDGAGERSAARPSLQEGAGSRNLRLAYAAGLVLWALTGIVLFSHMARLHPRYVEGFLPAVAALLGIGAAWASQPRGRLRPLVLVVALAVIVVYGERLLYGTSPEWWISALSALAAVLLAGVARLPSVPARLRTAIAPAAVLALTLCAPLAISFGADVAAINDHISDAGYVGALPAEELHVASDYLRAHQGSARYEVAAQSATQIGSLIVEDARPIVILTTYNARVFTSVTKLKRLIAAGELRYAFLNTPCPHHPLPTDPGCSAPAKWIRAHATDVSRQAGLARGGVIWLLPGAKR